MATAFTRLKGRLQKKRGALSKVGRVVRAVKKNPVNFPARVIKRKAIQAVKKRVC